MAVNFVKFERGLSSIYNRKRDNHSLDDNTLYFIYDNANAPDEGGKLYLGQRLISGGESVSSLGELSDVSLGTPSNGAMLWYNSTTEKWEPATAEMVAASSIGDALRANVSVIAAQEGKTKEQLLATITDKSEGDIAIVAGSPYVYDGNNWQSLADNELRTDINTLNTTVGNIDTRVTTLETSVGNIDSQIQQAIESANHLVYEVSRDGLPALAEAKNNTIYLVPSQDSAETDNFSEYLFVDGSFERLGTINDVSLEGYATETYVNNTVSNLASVSYVDSKIQAIDFTPYALKSEVGDISALNTSTGNDGFTLAQEVESLYQKLQWHELSE